MSKLNLKLGTKKGDWELIKNITSHHQLKLTEIWMLLWKVMFEFYITTREIIGRTLKHILDLPE